MVCPEYLGATSWNCTLCACLKIKNTSRFWNWLRKKDSLGWSKWDPCQSTVALLVPRVCHFCFVFLSPSIYSIFCRCFGYISFLKVDVHTDNPRSASQSTLWPVNWTLASCRESFIRNHGLRSATDELGNLFWSRSFFLNWQQSMKQSQGWN